MVPSSNKVIMLKLSTIFHISNGGFVRRMKLPITIVSFQVLTNRTFLVTLELCVVGPLRHFRSYHGSSFDHNLYQLLDSLLRVPNVSDGESSLFLESYSSVSRTVGTEEPPVLKGVYKGFFRFYEKMYVVV